MEDIIRPTSEFEFIPTILASIRQISGLMEECVHCYAGEILEVEEQVREVKRKSLKRNDTVSFSFFFADKG